MQEGLSLHLKGWVGSLPDHQEVASRCRGGMDEELGRDGRPRRRAGDFEEKVRGLRQEEGGCREREERAKFFGRELKEIQEEKEEEIQEGQKGEKKDRGVQRLEGAFRNHGFGSRPPKEEASDEKGASFRKEERPQREFIELQHQHLGGEQLRGGGFLRAFRGRDQGEDGVESVSGMPHPKCGGSAPTIPDTAVGTAVGVGQKLPAPSFLTVLAHGARPESFEGHLKRDADALFCDRSAVAGAAGVSSRCSHAEAEVPRTNGHWGRLPCDTKVGGGPNRGDVDVIHGRNAGGEQSSTGRNEGKERCSKGLGQERSKGRLRELGYQGLQRKEGRLWQGERKRRKMGFQKGRLQEGRGRQREEVRFEEEVADDRRSDERGVSPEVSGFYGRELVPTLASPVNPGATNNWLGAQAAISDGTVACSVHEEPEGAADTMAFHMDLLAKAAGLSRLKGLFKKGLAGCQVGDVFDVLCEVFDEVKLMSGVKHSKVQHSGGVFPLPETLCGLKNFTDGLKVDNRKAHCLLAMFRALNSYYGVSWSGGEASTMAKKSAVQGLVKYAQDVIGWEEKFDGVRWADLLSTRSIDYKGDEVRVSKQFRWSNIVSALPDEVGRIPLRDVCELGTLDYVINFEDYLLPLDAQVVTRPPRVMVAEDSWEQVCSGLVSKGICEIMPIQDLYQVDGSPILNGMFGVSKDEFDNGAEVMRLIMNLIPVNRLCRNLGGDVSTLPNWSGMGSYVLETGEVLLMSSEDIRCFFYLFSVPQSWKRFLGFNKVVPPHLVPDQWQGLPCVLVSRVLPMGFVNSVSIAQHIHRRVARLGLYPGGQGGSGLGSQCEIRRDKALPVGSRAFRIYLDNFDLLEKVDSRVASVIKGEVSLDTVNLRHQYSAVGLPRHPKKTVARETVAEIQGAVVNGVTGRVTPKPSKVLKYLSMGLQLLSEGFASQKQLQIVCGGLVYCTMFRRPLLGLLNGVWKFILSFEGEPPVVRKVIPPQVQFEIVRFLCAVPLAQMNLRSVFLGSVTASDASEYGGGFCVSKGLTPMGVHASHCSIRGDLPEVPDHVQVLTVGLFDGIGALRVCADALLLPMAGHVSSEVSKEGNRVVEAHFADSIMVGSVEQIDDAMVCDWAAKFSNVGVVLVGGGPPCQGVSGLNSDRKGALRDARSSLFPHVGRVHKLCQKRFPWAQVHFLMESVASMDDDDRYIMSQDIGVLPWRIDSFGLSLCHRPRLYWLSWDLKGGPGVSLVGPSSTSWYDYGEVRFNMTVNASEFLMSGCQMGSEEGLPTFTTSRPRSAPGNRPAGLWQCSDEEKERWRSDDYRYPPYQYRSKNMVFSPVGPRLPTIAEKEVIMGFPLHFTAPCLPKGQHQGIRYWDARHTLVGNTWNVQVVTWLMAGLFAPLGLTVVDSLESVLRQTSPGRSDTLRGFLHRLPLNPPKGPSNPEHQATLASKLSTFVSIKGEDILLQSPTEKLVRFQRLRASVPANLWRWKVKAGWRWKFGQAHINELELRAVLTTLTWRFERMKERNCRFIHLVDSLVVLHALSRGRSSSRKLRRPLCQINSLLLAADAHPVCLQSRTRPTGQVDE